MRSAAFARIAARCSVSVRDHSANARFAVATASSTSSELPAGTLPTTSSVAGLRTSISGISCCVLLRLTRRRGDYTVSLVSQVSHVAPCTEEEVRERLSSGRLVEGLRHMSPEYLEGIRRILTVS